MKIGHRSGQIINALTARTEDHYEDSTVKAAAEAALAQLRPHQVALRA